MSGRRSLVYSRKSATVCTLVCLLSASTSSVSVAANVRDEINKCRKRMSHRLEFASSSRV